MSDVYEPGPRARTVRDADGRVLEVPEGWALLPPGDAAATRRIKAGPHWVVQEQRGRRTFSRGIWAPEAQITAIREALDAERSTEAHARKQAAAKARRERDQRRYEGDFEAAVLAFLAFAPEHADTARIVAWRVAAHATPVGSGTVARTQRISLEERAEAAVIAWLRHQTTAYDHMQIARVKGRRREVRRQLAARSRALLGRYREGLEAADDCPLQRALQAGDEADRTPPPQPITAPQRVNLFAKLKRQLDKGR